MLVTKLPGQESSLGVCIGKMRVCIGGVSKNLWPVGGPDLAKAGALYDWYSGPGWLQ